MKPLHPTGKHAAPKKPGVLLAEDDLEVGQHVCVHSLKKNPDEAAPIFGQALQVKAICFPYVVGQLLTDSAKPTLTLDCRFLRFMRVTKEFVEAQELGAGSDPSPRLN